MTSKQDQAHAASASAALSEEDWRQRLQRARDLDAPMHPCCVEGCAIDTLSGLLACRDHWLALPRSIRYVLTTAFRKRAMQPDLYLEAVTIGQRLLNEAATDTHAPTAQLNGASGRRVSPG